MGPFWTNVHHDQSHCRENPNYSAADLRIHKGLDKNVQPVMSRWHTVALELIQGHQGRRKVPY